MPFLKIHSTLPCKCFVFFDYVGEQWGVSFCFQTIKHELGFRKRVVSTRVRNHDKNLVVRSCTISCTTILAVVRNRARIVHDKNRARQKSCATKIVHDVGLIRKNFRLIVLKYANFTNLDHLESILINFSAFLEKNY